MEFVDFIQKIQTHFRISGDVSLYEQGMQLTLNRDLLVRIKRLAEPFVCLESVVHLVKGEMQEAFYQAILKSNTTLPMGMYFSYDLQDQGIVLQEKFNLQEVDFKEFIPRLLDFVKMIRPVQEKMYFWEVRYFLRESAEDVLASGQVQGMRV